MLSAKQNILEIFGSQRSLQQIIYDFVISTEVMVLTESFIYTEPAVEVISQLA